MPYYIACADQPVFCFAGVWDRSVAEDGTETLSCTLITMPANALMAEIHNSKQRKPAILAARVSWQCPCGAGAVSPST